MNTETAGKIKWSEINLEYFNCIPIIKEFPHWTGITNTPLSGNKDPVKKIKHFKPEMQKPGKIPHKKGNLLEIPL